jgi:hypothetical protein
LIKTPSLVLTNGLGAGSRPYDSGEVRRHVNNFGILGHGIPFQEHDKCTATVVLERSIFGSCSRFVRDLEPRARIQ